MENACRRARAGSHPRRRGDCGADGRPPETPEPALLQFLGETAGMDPELIGSWSHARRRAVKDAAKKEAETGRRSLPTYRSMRRIAGPALGIDERHGTCRCTRPLQHLAPAPAGGARGRERWKRFRELTPEQQAAVREAYREFLELPPERRDALRNRWEQMSPEERRRAIQRRQGPKPGTIDKRPCPPC